MNGGERDAQDRAAEPMTNYQWATRVAHLMVNLVEAAKGGYELSDAAKVAAPVVTAFASLAVVDELRGLRELLAKRPASPWTPPVSQVARDAAGTGMYVTYRPPNVEQIRSAHGEMIARAIEAEYSKWAAITPERFDEARNKQAAYKIAARIARDTR